MRRKDAGRTARRGLLTGAAVTAAAGLVGVPSTAGDGGTETATYWHGYMDGAVRSGERAAKEITG